MGGGVYSIVIPVVDLSVRGLCSKPYPNHPKGCPNFKVRRSCPPKCPVIEDTLDLSRPVWAVWNVFPFGDHVRKMKLAHPDWTDRQLECCLYWQGTARKQLKEIVKSFLEEHPGLVICWTPEGQGVNLTETMASIGERLEWPPREKTYQVVLAGNRR